MSDSLPAYDVAVIGAGVVGAAIARELTRYARSVALVHLVELPLYLALLAWLAATQGVVGVAVAWTARMVVDTLVMWTVLYNRMPAGRAATRRVALLAVQCALVVAAAFVAVSAWEAR
jgi:glycine/D-amino acid oxidase-like deaminating enzyme